MKFHLITLFPDACDAYLSASIIGRARKDKKIAVTYQNPRDFVSNTWGKARKGAWHPRANVDGRPYGGGPGMVMQAMPVVKAVEKALGRMRDLRSPSSDDGLRKSKHGRNGVVIWLSPGAKQFTNKDADALATYENVVLVCGRYEGIDERAKRIIKELASESRNYRDVKRPDIRFREFAVGETTFTGGEIPALAIVDAVTRRLPGVLGKDSSVEERRIASRAVYTRPETIEFKKKKYRVPKVLQTGHHARIDAWREKQ